MNAPRSEPTEEMLNDPVGIELVEAIHHRLGAGRTSSADCTCPRSSGGHRRGINPDCPWDGIHPQTFVTTATP